MSLRDGRAGAQASAVDGHLRMIPELHPVEVTLEQEARAVAAQERRRRLHRSPGDVESEAPKKQSGRAPRHAEEVRLARRRDDRLERLQRALELAPVVLAEDLVERPAAEVHRLEAREPRERQPRGLEHERLRVH